MRLGPRPRGLGAGGVVGTDPAQRLLQGVNAEKALGLIQGIRRRDGVGEDQETTA